MRDFVKKNFGGLLIAVSFTALLMIISLIIWWRADWLAYQVYIPKNLALSPTPLLVALHGTGGDARTTQKWLGFDELADEYGFIVIYPHSPDGQWDAGAGILQRGMDKRTRRDDPGYIVKIIEEVAEARQIDREKVVIAGVSDGASMAIRLSCELDGTFAGMASVAATIPVYAIKNCESAKPVSALLLHGRQDPVLPWDGKSYRGVRIYLSLEESVNWWLSRNACDSQDEDQDYQQYVGQVDRKHFQHCRGNTEVLVYRVNDGGHAWPMRDHPEGRTMGQVNRDIDATSVIVEWMMAL